MIVHHFLPKALFISLTLHTIFVCSSYWMNRPELRKVKNNKVEITYRRPNPQTLDIRQHSIKPSQKLDLQNSMLSGSDGAIGVKLNKTNESLKGMGMYERKPSQIKSLQANHIKVTPITSEKINNPIYTLYKERIRNKIYERAYSNFSQGFQEKGVVYLTFIISSDGSLKDYRIIEAKTNASQNLHYLSIKSLKEAQFPSFIKGMTLPEYTFNVEIDYQVN